MGHFNIFNHLNLIFQQKQFKLGKLKSIFEDQIRFGLSFFSRWQISTPLKRATLSFHVTLLRAPVTGDFSSCDLGIFRI